MGVPVLHLYAHFRKRKEMELESSLASSSSDGRVMSSIAMDTRRLWPPDTPRMCQLPIGVSAQSESSMAAITSATSAALEARAMRRGSRTSAPYWMHSRTKRTPIRTSSWEDRKGVLSQIANISFAQPCKADFGVHNLGLLSHFKHLQTSQSRTPGLSRFLKPWQ